MAALPRSGRSLPAPLAALCLDVIVDLLGRNGADAVLRSAGLADWIERPPRAESSPVDFSDLSALLGALQDTLGLRGARGLQLRMGARAFETLLAASGAVAAMQDPAFQALPIERRMPAGLHAVATRLNQIGPIDAATESDGTMVRLVSCPECWGRRAADQSCALMTGLLHQGLRWIAPEAEVTIEETACRAFGDPACDFAVRPLPAP